MASSLVPHELYKYEWRQEILLDQIRNGDLIELVDGSFTTIRWTETLEERIRLGQVYRSLVRGAFLESDSGCYKLSDLRKTNMFGGLGMGSTTAVEQREIRHINRQFEMVKPPALRSKVGVHIAMGEEIHEVKNCKSVPGVPKADFCLANMKYKPVTFISHKAGGGPTAFQQWSGISDRAGPGISNHEEVKEFVARIRQLFPSGLPPATAVGMRIQDRTLQHQAVYGPKFGQSKYGIDNVHAVYEGRMTLQELDKGVYTFKAEGVHWNGDVLKGAYEPILYVQYRGDRAQFGIPNARFAIYPLGGNKKTVML